MLCISHHTYLCRAFLLYSVSNMQPTVFAILMVFVTCVVFNMCIKRSCSSFCRNSAKSENILPRVWMSFVTFEQNWLNLDVCLQSF